MSPREQLNSYINELQRRLRLGTMARGAAIVTVSALATTILLVLVANSFAFSKGSITGARLALLVALAFAASFGLAIPLRRLTRRHAVGQAESAFPHFQQRLVTFAERDRHHASSEPFIELLAEDTLRATRGSEPTLLVSDRKLLGTLGVGLASLGVLLWMVLAGPGYLGYGASLLWAGGKVSAPPLYDIHVSPGNATVRRNADQLVTALPVGMETNTVKLYALYEGSSKWDQVTMQPQQGAPGFQFLFAGLPKSVEYYLEAGPYKSQHFNLRVIDLPSVKQIRATYRYPAWTGLKNEVQERGGDLRAVQGTDADVELLLDRPLRDGLLVVGEDQQIHLSGGDGNVYKGTIHMDKDGMYHVAALDQGQPVRLSEDFFIEANQPKAPEVQVSRPGRDYRASPIEEVTVAVKASDDFGLSSMNLHYSVNGGEDKTVNLLKQKGTKEAGGSTVIALEDYKMVPGDVVSVYATANDARAESRTDMFFIQADPFEREFSQSQAGGGGGGGGGGMGGSQADISQREKEIIAATWKQQGDKEATKKEIEDTGKFLAQVQSTLADQARSLSNRVQSRELTGANDDFNNFVKDMNGAAAAMVPASQKLQGYKWGDAIPDEQKALQYLLRAEATFRQIQIAFGSAGGGGGGGSAGRDLASLFDLELDTEKNQYETGQSASSADQKSKDIDDALRKLDELARRQEELAAQQRNTQTSEQRWQQEMLRRDAEQLQRQMEQLANNQQQGGASGQSASGQSQSNSGQAGGSQSDQRSQQALDRLRQATEDMRRAAAGQESDAEARRAADRLREATNMLGGMQQQSASGRLDGMARESERLADEQQKQTDRMKQLAGQSYSGQALQQAYKDLAQLAGDRQKLSDDLAKLEKQMRDAERELASNQHDASTKLRDALGQMEVNDLETRVQRSADRLRRGIDSSAATTESEIADGLQHLKDNLHDVQQALGTGQNQPGPDASAADRLARLRDRLQGLDPNGRRQGGPGGQQYQPDQLSRNGQPGQAGQAGQGGQGQQLAQGGMNGQGGRGGQIGPGGGGYGDRGSGNQWIDTGNNTGHVQATSPDTSPLPGDTESAIQQSVNELNQVRQSVQGDPETEAEVDNLIRELQKLDPRRFPGNPAMVEQLHAQVLSDVDKLELQLRRAQDDQQSSQVRSNDPVSVPQGYQDAVAEYFRRLSKR